MHSIHNKAFISPPPPHVLYYMDPIFKRNFHGIYSIINSSNPRNLFVVKYIILLCTHTLHTSHDTSQHIQRKSTLKCVPFWSSSASSWPSPLFVIMFDSILLMFKIAPIERQFSSRCAHSKTIWFDSFLYIFQHSGSPPDRVWWWSMHFGTAILVRQLWNRHAMRCNIIIIN
jgi:hypothetical protein